MLYPPSQQTFGLHMDMNAKNKINVAARCHPRNKADNRDVAEGEVGYLNWNPILPVGFHNYNVVTK